MKKTYRLTIDYMIEKTIGSGKFRLSENAKFVIFNEKIATGGGKPPVLPLP